MHQGGDKDAARAARSRSWRPPGRSLGRVPGHQNGDGYTPTVRPRGQPQGGRGRDFKTENRFGEGKTGKDGEDASLPHGLLRTSSAWREAPSESSSVGHVSASEVVKGQSWAGPFTTSEEFRCEKNTGTESRSR